MIYVSKLINTTLYLYSLLFAILLTVSGVFYATGNLSSFMVSLAFLPVTLYLVFTTLQNFHQRKHTYPTLTHAETSTHHQRDQVKPARSELDKIKAKYHQPQTNMPRRTITSFFSQKSPALFITLGLIVAMFASLLFRSVMNAQATNQIISPIPTIEIHH